MVWILHYWKSLSITEYNIAVHVNYEKRLIKAQIEHVGIGLNAAVLKALLPTKNNI